MMYSFVLSGDNLVVMVNNHPYTVNNNHPNYHAIMNGIKDNIGVDDMMSLINESVLVPERKFSDEFDNVTFDGDNVYVDGQVLYHSIVDRIRQFHKENLPYKNLLKFINNLHSNPSFNSREQAYNFLEHSMMPITEDGCFLAYKSVDSNYMDHHTHKVCNKPGNTIEMDRSKVDDNPNNHCSSGFHVATLRYASGFGGSRSKLVIVKINPKDIVCVPNDYSCEKCIICKYYVVSDYEEPLSKSSMYTEDANAIYSDEDNEHYDYSLDDFDDDVDYDDYYDYDDVIVTSEF